jgi:hypothetical protein
MRRIFLIGLALGFTACLGGTTGPVSVVGTYNLQTVNGSPLPYTYPNGVVLQSEVLTLKADGTFTDVATRVGSAASDAGIFTNFSGTVTFSDETINQVYQGQLSGNTMTTVVGGFTQRFLKQ